MMFLFLNILLSSLEINVVMSLRSLKQCKYLAAEGAVNSHILFNFLTFCPYFLYLRYVTILTLVRVRTEQKGLYTVLVTNGDDTKEVTFDLEVRGERLF